LDSDDVGVAHGDVEQLGADGAAGQWSQLRQEVVADPIPSAVITGDQTVPGQVLQRVGCEAWLGRGKSASPSAW